MRASDNLFSLIKSLTKSEKRYFKVIATKKNEKGSNYLQLFNAIDEQDEYNEEELIRRFSNETFIRHLPSEKNYLYSNILKILVQFHEGNFQFMELDEIRHSAIILYNKGLYDQCNKMLTKARKQAISNELFPELLSIAKIQLELLPMIAPDAEELKGGFDAILKDEQLAFQKLENINKYHQLYARFLFLVRTNGEWIRNEQELQQFNEIMQNELMQDERYAICYKSKEMYFFISSMSSFLSGDLEEAYQQGLKGLDFLEKNLTKLTPVAIYSARVSNQAEVCLRMKKWNMCEIYLEKIQCIEVNSVQEKSKNFYRYYDLLLRLQVAKGTFQQAIDLVQTIEEGVKYYEENIHPARVINMYYYIAYAYFALEDYRTALRWVNRIILSKTDLRSDLLCFARLLNLILHIELDNNLQLEHVFKSTYTYFNKRNRLFKIEDCFLKFLKKSLHMENKEEQKSLYISLKNELMLILNNSYEQRALDYFDFISWLESKIENRSFKEIMQQKNSLQR